MGTQSFIERRRSKRVQHKSQVIFTCDTSSNVILGAETSNYNKNGAQITSSYLPERASEIFIAWTDQDDFPHLWDKINTGGKKFGKYGEYRGRRGSNR